MVNETGQVVTGTGELVLMDGGKPIEGALSVTETNLFPTVRDADNQPIYAINPETGKVYAVNVKMVDIGPDRYYWNGTEWETVQNEWVVRSGNLCTNDRWLIDGHIKFNEADLESGRIVYERLLKGMLRLMWLDQGRKGGPTWQGLKDENGRSFASIDDAYAYALTGKPVTGFRIPFGVDDPDSEGHDGGSIQLKELSGSVNLETICVKVLPPSGFFVYKDTPKIIMAKGAVFWGSWGAVSSVQVNGEQRLVVLVGSKDTRNSNTLGEIVLTTDPSVNDPATLAEASRRHVSYLVNRLEKADWMPKVGLKKLIISAFSWNYSEDVLPGTGPLVGR